MSGNANQNTFISRNNSQLLQNPSQPSTLSKIAPEAYDGLPRTLSEEVNDRFGEGEQTGTMSCMLHRVLYPKAHGNGFKKKKTMSCKPAVGGAGPARPPARPPQAIADLVLPSPRPAESPPTNESPSIPFAIRYLSFPICLSSYTTYYAENAIL